MLVDVSHCILILLDLFGSAYLNIALSGFIHRASEDSTDFSDPDQLVRAGEDLIGAMTQAAAVTSLPPEIRCFRKRRGWPHVFCFRAMVAYIMDAAGRISVPDAYPLLFRFFISRFYKRENFGIDLQKTDLFLSVLGEWPQ